jgi:hypothetical protein
VVRSGGPAGRRLVTCHDDFTQRPPRAQSARRRQVRKRLLMPFRRLALRASRRSRDPRMQATHDPRSGSSWPRINTDRPAETRATRGWLTSRSHQKEPASWRARVLSGGIGSSRRGPKGPASAGRHTDPDPDPCPSVFFRGSLKLTHHHDPPLFASVDLVTSGAGRRPRRRKGRTAAFLSGLCVSAHSA